VLSINDRTIDEPQVSQNVAGTLNPGSATDVYRFVGLAGDRLTFDWLTSTTNNGSWTLYSPQMLQSNGGTVALGGTGFGNDFTVTLPAEGTYTLAVAGFDASPLNYSFRVIDTYEPFAPTVGTGGFNLNALTTGTLAASGAGATQTFTFTAPAGRVMVFDNQSANGGLYLMSLAAPGGARNIFGPFGTTGTPTPDSGVQLYKFNGTAGERIAIDLLSGSNLGYQVFGPNNQGVSGFLQSDAFFTLPETGQYTLYVQGLGTGGPASTQPFGFRAYRSPVNTSAYTLGNTVAGTLAPPGQVDRANNPGGATLGGTLTVNAVSGTATFSNLTLDKIGTGYTLQATSAGLPNQTSAAFNVSAAVATQVVFGVQPTNTTAGVAISPAVTVRLLDAFGNQTTSTAAVTVAIGANPGGGTLTGAATVTAVNGVATFGNLSINRSGTGYTLAATSGTLAGATSAAFDILPNLAVSPTVLGTLISGQSGAGVAAVQRSMANSLVVNFSTVVTIDAGAFTISRVGGGTVNVEVSTTVMGGRTVATLTCTDGPATFQMAGNRFTLIDGRYTLTIDASKVRDAATNLFLNGNGAGGNYVFGWANTADKFFRLFGDVNGNEAVDGPDVTSFQAAYGVGQPADPDLLAYFHFDGDGVLRNLGTGATADDTFQFKRRFGRSL
jgi:hypothetical protein